MILLSGGTDGGDVKRVVEMAEMLAAADPKARLGAGYQLPVIYAGNTRRGGDRARNAWPSRVALSIGGAEPAPDARAREPRPGARRDPRPVHGARDGARARLQEADDLVAGADHADAGRGRAHHREDREARRPAAVVGVDIGGATTDVFSVFQGVFNRTVSANLGMSYSVSNVMAEAGIENILRWVPFAVDEVELRNRIKNKMIRPTTIPQTLEDLVIEQAIAREALRLAFEQHKSLAVGLKGVQTERTISDIMPQTASGSTLVNLRDLGLLVGSGGVLSHAPRRVAGGADDDRRVPARGAHRAGGGQHLHDAAARRALDRARGGRDPGVRARLPDPARRGAGADRARASPGQPCVTVEIRAPGQPAIDRAVPFGELVLLPLPTDGHAHLTAAPERGFDLGAGKGRPLEAEVRGGVVGLIVDTRGRRPFALPDDRATRIERLRSWNRALDVYPREV